MSHLQEADGVSVLDATTLAPVATVDVPAGAVAFAGLSMQGPLRLAAGWRQAARAASTRLGPVAEDAPAGRTGATRSFGGGVVISDAEFNPADWAVSGSGEHDTTQVVTGGNPGAWRRMVHFGPAVTEHRLIRPGSQYNPSTQGAIGRIEVSWDRRIFAETLVSERFLVEQDNVVYRTVERNFFNLQRRVGTQGAVSVDLRIEYPNGSISQQTITWPDGDGTDRPILVLFLTLPDGAGARTARLTLVNPTGGASINPTRRRMLITVFPEEWPPVLQQLFLRLQALLGGFSPAWLLVLAAPATALTFRHSRSRKRTQSAA